jgi:hypothetical protein
VLLAIHVARVFGLFDGSDAAPPEMLTVQHTDKTTTDHTAKYVPNPNYDTWIT